ncbi:alpha-amylase [Streptomyces purpurascens]
MVGFRNATRGEAVTNWWTTGATPVRRGSKGFVAIEHKSGPLSRTYQTSLPGGDLCDIRRHNRELRWSVQHHPSARTPRARPAHAGRTAC